jgi:hypothetical protein
MLKRTREIVAAIAEQAGIVAPSVQDSQGAAEQRRVDLTAAQSALDAAVVALEAGHDSQLPDKEIERLEAAETDARVSVDRCQRSYKAAEKRLTAARAIESEKVKGVMRVRLDVALKERAQCAERINNAALAIAEALADFNKHDNVIREAMAAGVVGRDATYTLNMGRRVVDLALRKHGALEGAGTGIIELPGAAELVAQHNAALAAV